MDLYFTYLINLSWNATVMTFKRFVSKFYNFRTYNSAVQCNQTLEKHVTSMSCRLEPAIWSHDTGQQIPYFDRCQLIITWMSDIKEVHGKPRLHVSVNLLEYGRHVARPYRRRPPSTAVVVVVRTRPRAIPLAMVHMRKSIHGFPSVP